MKTTVEIPESLFRQAKIRATEKGMSFRDLVLDALRRELSEATQQASIEQNAPYWSRRVLLPEYRRLLESGALRGGTDSTRITSEERDAR